MTGMCYSGTQLSKIVRHHWGFHVPPHSWHGLCEPRFGFILYTQQTGYESTKTTMSVPEVCRSYIRIYHLTSIQAQVIVDMGSLLLTPSPHLQRFWLLHAIAYLQQQDCLLSDNSHNAVGAMLHCKLAILEESCFSQHCVQSVDSIQQYVYHSVSNDCRRTK